MEAKDELLTDVLQGRKTLLFDGGFGTMLQQQGLSIPGKPTDDLCITASNLVTEIHKAYVDAGAQVATTNTFNTNARALKKQCSPYSVEEIYAAAAQCARDAGPFLVAGDIGPVGEFLEPYGELDGEEAYKLYAQNARAAQEAGCDFVAIETMMDVREAELAVRAARENTELPVFATLSFNQDGRTLFGATPEQAVATLLDVGVSALGMNCSVGPAEALPVIQAYARALHAAVDAPDTVGAAGAAGVAAAANDVAKRHGAAGFAVPLIVQPNAGLPDMTSGKAQYHCSPQEFCAAVSLLIEAGATIVGGCCGTTPEHIAAVREILG